MRLRSLTLHEFKNYRRLDLELPPEQILILVGDNGAGKTNLLESISILALSKSFTYQSLSEAVHWKARNQTDRPAFLSIAGTVRTGGRDVRLEVICGIDQLIPKTLKRDGLTVRSKDYVGHLRRVLFTPLDLHMVSLAPLLRRRWIDTLISQVNAEYLHHLLGYQAVLKHRNRLLRNVREGLARAQELDFWDEKLVEHGVPIIRERRIVTGALNEKFSPYYQALCGEASELQISWQTLWGTDEVGAFAHYLASRRERDIAAATTCGGPHRENFHFLLNGQNLGESGSRGECRSAVLALKLSEQEYMKTLSGETPLLLLDDVFSELDQGRQKNLLSLLQSEQVIISTTHLDFEVPGAAVWRVKGGRIFT